MFEELSEQELYELDGGVAGIVITGAMVAKGIACLAGGCAIGWYLGRAIWR